MACTMSSLFPLIKILQDYTVLKLLLWQLRNGSASGQDTSYISKLLQCDPTWKSREKRICWLAGDYGEMAKFIIAQLKTLVIRWALVVCASRRAIVSIIICLHLASKKPEPHLPCSGAVSARSRLSRQVRPTCPPMNCTFNTPLVRLDLVTAAGARPLIRINDSMF